MMLNYIRNGVNRLSILQQQQYSTKLLSTVTSSMSISQSYGLQYLNYSTSFKPKLRPSYNNQRNMSIGYVQFSSINFKSLIYENKFIDYMLGLCDPSKDKTVFNELIDYFLKTNNRVTVTVELYEALEKKGFFIGNIFAVNRFIEFFKNVSASAKSRGGSMDEAELAANMTMRIWKHLDSNVFKVSPNIKSLNIMLEHYMDLKMVKEAEQFIDYIKKSNLTFSNATLDLFIRFYFETNKTEKAMDFFNKVKKENLAHYSWALKLMVLSLNDAGNMERLVTLVNSKLPFVPKFIACEEMLPIYRYLLKTNQTALIEGYLPLLTNADAFNRMMRAYMEVGDIDKVSELFNAMQSANIIPNETTYAMFITYYSKQDSANEMITANHWIDSYFNSFETPSNHMIIMIMEHFKSNNYYKGMTKAARRLAALPNIYEITNALIYLANIDGYVNVHTYDMQPLVTESESKEMKMKYELQCPPTREVIWSVLDERKYQDTKSKVIGQLIQHYLFANNYKDAIKLNKQRTEECKMDPNNFIVSTFWAYHKIYNQDELSDYWMNQANQLGIDLGEQNRSNAIDYFMNYNVEEKTASIEKFNKAFDITIKPHPLDTQLKHLLLKKYFSHQNLLQQREESMRQTTKQ